MHALLPLTSVADKVIEPIVDVATEDESDVDDIEVRSEESKDGVLDGIAARFRRLTLE